MGRIEKTIFLSYRRTDEWVGVAIFQDLTQHGYDVFIDYDGIASGNFESVILDNIKSRAHFLVLLTPTELARCGNPKDWMRREIEAALDYKRNIVPLMVAGFDFDRPATANQLTGKLAALKEYNGLEIPKARFFASEMERLRDKYLNVPVDAVLHTASESAQQVAKEQKDKALNVRVDAVLHSASDSAQTPWTATLERYSWGLTIVWVLRNSNEVHTLKLTPHELLLDGNKISDRRADRHYSFTIKNTKFDLITLVVRSRTIEKILANGTLIFELNNGHILVGGLEPNAPTGWRTGWNVKSVRSSGTDQSM